MFWKYDRKNDGEEIVILCDIDFKLQGRAHIGSVSLNDFSHNLMPASQRSETCLSWQLECLGYRNVYLPATVLALSCHGGSIYTRN